MDNLDTGNAPVETQAATEGLQPETPVSAPVENAPTEPRSIRDTMMEVYDKHNPARAENGKFAPKEQPVEAQEAKTAETTDQPTETPIETAPPSIEAPNSWSAEMKAKFGTLPPDVREFIAKRESESHKAITQLGERAKAYEPLAQTVTKHDGFIQRFGLSREQAIDNLFTAAQHLQNDPAGFIRHIAQTHGVDLNQMVTGEPGQQMVSDPRVAQLEARIAQMQQLLSNQQRQQEEVRTKSVESEIEAFAKDKAHWAELEQDMLMEVTAIRAAEPDLSTKQILEKAYERAKFANPNVRARILEDQRKADEDKRRVEAEKKAAEARKISNLNQRSNRGASPAAPTTMRDSMRSVAEKYYGSQSF